MVRRWLAAVGGGLEAVCGGPAAVGGGPAAAPWRRVAAEGNRWWVTIGVIWSFHIEKYSYAMGMR